MDNNNQTNNQSSPTPVSRPNEVPQRPNLDAQPGVPKPIQRPNLSGGIPKPVGRVNPPIAPTPVAPTPVAPTPVVAEPSITVAETLPPIMPTPTPMVAEPIMPTPMAAEPIMPTPVAVEPIMPTPTPVAVEPIMPTPMAAEPIMPTPEVVEPVPPVEQQERKSLQEIAQEREAETPKAVTPMPEKKASKGKKEKAPKAQKAPKKKGSSVAKVFIAIIVIGAIVGGVLFGLPLLKGNKEGTKPLDTEQQSKPAKQEPSISEEDVLAEEAADKKEENADPQGESESAPDKNEYGVTLYELASNKEIDMKDIRITNLEVKTDTKIDGVELKEGNIFLIMEIAMQNNTDVVVNSGFKPVVEDKEGKETEITMEDVAVYEKEGAYKVTDLKPEESTQGVVVMQVPKEFKKVSLSFKGYSVWETAEEVRLIATPDNL